MCSQDKNEFSKNTKNKKDNKTNSVIKVTSVPFIKETTFTIITGIRIYGVQELLSELLT